MGLYSQILHIHSEKPIPTPTATRKNQTQLMLFAKWLDSALGGLSKVQGYDCRANTEGEAKAAQTVSFGAMDPNDAVGVQFGTGRAIVDSGASPSGVVAAAAFAALVGSSSAEVGTRYVYEASSLRGKYELLAETVGLKFSIGQWEFVAITATPTEYGQFTIGNGDAAAATSLALAINKHPQCSRYFGARANRLADGDVEVWVFGSPPGGHRLATTDEKLTPTQPDYSATALARTMERSALGNGVTIEALGTGVTVGGAALSGAVLPTTPQLTGVA